LPQEPEPEAEPAPEPKPDSEPEAEPVPEAAAEAEAEPAPDQAPEPEPEPPPQPIPQSTPGSVPGDNWYYLRPNLQESVGPIHAEELKHLFVTGKIAKTTPVWTEGMANWEEIGHVVALQKTEKVKLNISSPGSPKPGSGGGSGSDPHAGQR
jgi:hypothetical protein